jgi:hypothetical protein
LPTKEGPDEYCLLFYYGWIQQQCEFALYAFEELEGPIKDSSRSVFFAQTIINAASNISKLFRPGKARDESLRKYSKERGRILRAKYGIDENEVMLDRNLRDDLEHFDERLDKWTCEQDCSSSQILNKSYIIAMNYDPGSGNAFTFKDHSVAVSDLKPWISRVREQSIKLSQKIWNLFESGTKEQEKPPFRAEKG